MGFTHIKFYSVGVFFFQKWGGGWFIPGEVSYFIFFPSLKKPALQTFTCYFKMLFQNNLQILARDSQTLVS